MIGKAAGVVLIGLLTGSAAAYAASGSLSDPKGDSPDIVKLAYDNARSKVFMTMTYGSFRPQNESFYMRWGTRDRHYQVFVTRTSGGTKELRYSGAEKKVTCGGLLVKHPTSRSTKVVIPRSCLSKAPDKLRFQGIATEGLFSMDETKVSKAIARG
jgi:hypothetical protein